MESRLGERLGDRLGDREWQILETVWSKPTTSIAEMAKYFKISTTAVEKTLKS